MRKGPAIVLTGLAGLAALGLYGPGALASRSPLLGASLAPWDRTAQHEAALAALNAKQGPLTLAYARQAVRAMPYEQFGLTVASSTGDAKHRLEALNLSSAFGWRDPTTNVRLVEAALNEGDPVIAAQRIDALGRTQDAGVAGPYADRLLAKPGGIKALADRAAWRGPLDWWNRYFQQPAANPQVMTLRAALVRSLDPGDGSWLRDAVADMAKGFSAAGTPEQGLALWRDTLTKPGDFNGLVYDGHLNDVDPSRRPVGGEWRVASRAPASVEAMQDGGIAIRQISRRAGQVLGQFLLLEPGRYVLRTLGEVEGGNPGQFAWTLRCEGGAPLALEPRGRVSGAIGEWNVTVPAGCKSGLINLDAGQQPGTSNASLLLRSVYLGKAG